MASKKKKKPEKSREQISNEYFRMIWGLTPGLTRKDRRWLINRLSELEVRDDQNGL